MGFFSKSRDINDQRFAETLHGQITDASVQWILQHAWDSTFQELMFFFEPDAPRPNERNWERQVQTQFAADRKLGLIQGVGHGHAFFRTAFLRNVADSDGPTIHEYVSLAKAFFAHGYHVRIMPFLQCEGSQPLDLY